MKISATVIAALAGSFAYAATQQGATRSLPEPGSGALEESGEAKSMPGALGSTDGCPDGDSVTWFASEPRLLPNECSWRFGMLADGRTAADVNGDGRDEYLQVLPCPAFSLSPLNCNLANAWGNGIGLIWSRAEPSPGATAARAAFVPIVPDAASFEAWIRSRFPGFTNLMLYMKGEYAGQELAGWRDVDDDGDLDYVVFVHGNNAEGSGPPTAYLHAQVWFENIGYEKSTPPLAADLNGDGWVNGIDLGLLLGAWGRRS